MNHYTATSDYLKGHGKVIVNVLLITFLQRFALFFVTWFVYRAFGLHGASVYDVVMLQAVVSVSVDMLPLPGGMGISENLFLIIFKTIFVRQPAAAGYGFEQGDSFLRAAAFQCRHDCSRAFYHWTQSSGQHCMSSYKQRTGCTREDKEKRNRKR